jgi:mRNA export factor
LNSQTKKTFEFYFGLVSHWIVNELRNQVLKNEDLRLTAGPSKSSPFSRSTLSLSQVTSSIITDILTSKLEFPRISYSEFVDRFLFLVKFWDTRQPTPLKQLTFAERVYAADVLGPMAVITTADRAIQIYSLDQGPTEYKKFDSLLKYQHRSISIFTDKNQTPNGFAIGSIEGRVAIMYVETKNPAVDNFTFKCHRSNPTTPANTQDIYSVNDVAFHPTHGTLATVGSDGRYSFWDKDERTKLKTSDVINDQPLTCCAVDSRGQLFAYASSYDWHKGHEGNVPTKKNAIFFKQCFEEMKPKPRR